MSDEFPRRSACGFSLAVSIRMLFCLLSLLGCSQSEQQEEAVMKTNATLESRIDELIRKINEVPNGPVHVPYTPAVDELIEFGPPVLNHMLGLMLSNDFNARHAAQVVIQDVTMEMFNDPPKAVCTFEEEERWRQLWQTMGNLDAQDTLERRQDSVRRWREWLANRKTE